MEVSLDRVCRAVIPIPHLFPSVLCTLQYDTPHAVSHLCCEAALNHGVPSPSLGLPSPSPVQRQPKNTYLEERPQGYTPPQKQ